mgnify:CR=1 FL=1
MVLRRWQELYARAESASQTFFSEHFGDLGARCAEAAETAADPSICCCRRTNFVPEILTDPLLGELADESLGHSLYALSGPHNRRGCAALGPAGCLLPFGRPDPCHAYICDALYDSLDAILPLDLLCRIRDALEVYSRIREAPRRDDSEFQGCVAQVAELEALFSLASEQIWAQSAAFALRKEEALREMLPPAPIG